MFMALGIAQLLTQQQVLLPSFAELEREAARTDMGRVANTIERELDLLTINAGDYGNWIDTYQYMQDRNQEYVTINLTESTIHSLRVNVWAYVALDGSYVWTTGREVETGKSIDFDLLAEGRLPGDHPWQTALRSGTAMAGLLSTNQGPMLAALAPVLNGQLQGPHRGMLLLGRLLTDDEIARIGSQAQVRLSKLALRASASGPESPSETVIEHDTVTEVVRVFRDISGAPALMLRIEVPRTISAYGFKAVSTATLFLLGSGVVVLLLMIALLNREVLSPLARMTRHALALGKSDDLTSRLDLKRADELGELAREFDEMVGRLDEARRQLVDQSFDAGIAENASGVLHNLGNAITPLSVKVAHLQKSLTLAPTGDVGLALEELAQGVPDAARKSDLDEFLRLTSQELAGVVTGALREVESVTRMTEAMQQIIGEQAQHARSDKVIETIGLSELVEQSVELVSPDLRKLLSIEVDGSLRELGIVRVARTTLKQVFLNLIVNAAEAIRDAGQESGLLRISARVMQQAAGEQIELIFADNGPGIPASNLPRIFEKGFSTKSQQTNRGIGLHWCANAMNSLGGHLRAESAGPNRGATIHVVVALDRAPAIPVKRVA
jgi:sensor domain CHASE-containing protein